MRKCINCGKKFKAYHKDTGKFCSAECRKKVMRDDINRKRKQLKKEMGLSNNTGIFWKEKMEIPVMAFDYRFSIPFNINLSKNRMNGYNNGKYYKNPETKAMQEMIMWELKNKKYKFKQDKVYISIMVQKMYFQTDAQNFVDTICDAIEKGIGINDKWFVLDRVDWEMVKEKPKIFIGVAQHETIDKKACSCCGRILPIDDFVGIKTKSGDCRKCRSFINKR